MLLLFILFCFLSVVLFWSCLFLSTFFSVSLLGLIMSEVPLSFCADKTSLVCLMMLLFCGCVALFYCYHYFGGAESANLLYPLMVWFLFVMGILILSSSFLLSLVMWEYLGLVSFFLIIFYSNMSSLRASLITVFASRFGDVSLFFLIMWSLSMLDLSLWVIIILSSFVVLTKSACFPFISWLLEAMRAPTPVSSLVHSSTLVAAGVWFFFRYSWFFEDTLLTVFLVFSIVTIIVSGVSALFFYDLKKLVALSTCNNISWCLLFFVCGDLDLALLQLLTHGICKCYLFMCIGDLMGSSGSSQSSVGVYLLSYTGKLGAILSCVLILSLCGIPFLGVFFSKHGLFSELLYIYGPGYAFLILLCLLLSYCYSFRFILLLMCGCGGLSLGYVSYFILSLFLGFLGSLMNFFGSGILIESISLSVGTSFIIIMIQLLGCGAGLVFYLSSLGLWGVSWSSLFYSDVFVKSFYSSYLLESFAGLLSFYRWEYYFLGLWRAIGESFSDMRRFFFSFNVLVLSIIISLIFSLVLFY